MSTEGIKPITIKKIPIMLNKNIILMKGIKPLKTLQNSFKEDIIYTSKEGDFTSGDARYMTIVNRLNNLTKVSQTVAKCQSHSGEYFEKTSDEITKLIGQNNYDILLSSLCSIISQELKVRSINSLLTVPKHTRSVSCQTECNNQGGSLKKWRMETSCQTNETCFEELKKFKVKRRNKRQPLVPCVVKDSLEEKKLKKVVISPSNFEMLFIKEESNPKNESLTTEASLPELGPVFDEDSNNSLGRFSSLSVRTTEDLMVNPLNMLIDKHTKDTTVSNRVNEQDINATERYLHNLDSQQNVMSNEQLGFKEMLRSAPPEQRVKLLLRQGLRDWKLCLTRDNEGYLPIHVAVLTNDVDLLRRNCLVLKMRDTSVDVTADGLTPLRMSLFQENTQLTALLLDFGADPLDADDDDRTVFHIAAEMTTEHLPTLVNYCQQNARKVLQDNEELWKPAYETKTDEELAPILLMHINKSYDSQGYTPLMLACKLGKYNNVRTLVESCRQAVNLKMPNSGNTALYLAVGAACMDAAERGNKTKVVDHFRKTVEILVENGADPNIDNFAGSSVNDLLTEFNISELSMLIANKLTSIRYFDGQLPHDIKGTDFMLFKDDSGTVNIRGMNRKKTVSKTPAKLPAKNTSKSSPVILENIAYKPPVNAGNSSQITVKQELASSGNSPKLPSDPANRSLLKPKNVNITQNYSKIVKNFTLNQPVVIKSEVKNNKRKLNIVYEPVNNKKQLKTD